MEHLTSEIRPEMDLTVNKGNTRTGCLKNLMFILIFTANLRGTNPSLTARQNTEQERQRAVCKWVDDHKKSQKVQC